MYTSNLDRLLQQTPGRSAYALFQQVHGYQEAGAKFEAWLFEGQTDEATERYCGEELAAVRAKQDERQMRLELNLQGEAA